MTSRPIVIDSSAILAEIKDEPGADEVRLIMTQPPKGGFIMHTINVCEVAYHLIKFGLVESIAYELAVPDGVKVVSDVPPALWQRTASLKATYKNLALGDCIVIALAESFGAHVLTGDRGFQNVNTNVKISLFR